MWGVAEGIQDNSWFETCSLVTQRVKNPPAVQETWVQSLDWEDPLEKGMGTHSSILAWRIPWTEEPSRLQFMGLQRVGHDWTTNFSPVGLTTFSVEDFQEAKSWWNKCGGNRILSRKQCEKVQRSETQKWWKGMHLKAIKICVLRREYTQICASLFEVCLHFFGTLPFWNAINSSAFRFLSIFPQRNIYNWGKFSLGIFKTLISLRKVRNRCYLLII